MKFLKATLAVLPILLGTFAMTPISQAAAATGTVCSKVVTYKLINEVRTTVVDGRKVRQLVTKRGVVTDPRTQLVKYVPVKVSE